MLAKDAWKPETESKNVSKSGGRMNETQDWQSKDDCNLFKGFHGRLYYHCKSRIYLFVAREMKNTQMCGDGYCFDHL